MVAEFKMNQEKLKQLQAQVRIGGKGTARRKKKVVHRTATTDDKKLQSSLKKLSVNNIPGIEEVNMIKDDGSVIHFNNPKVQASLAANTFAVTGHAENKQITEMLPGILNQLGAESLTHLKRLASNVTGGAGLGEVAGAGDDDDDEVPDLVENFDEASKDEKATEGASEEAKISEDQDTKDATKLEPVAQESESEPLAEELNKSEPEPLADAEPEPLVADELDKSEPEPLLSDELDKSEPEPLTDELDKSEPEPLADELDSLIAQTEAVAQSLDEVEVSEETPAKEE